MLTGDSLAGLSNADSIVELVGVSGYLSRADSVAGVTHDLNLKLTNAGEISALSITDGYQKDKHIFAGSVCGTGTFARATSKCGTLTYIFTGDVSGWEGKFSHAPEKDIGTAGLACTLLTFNGSREVNAAVTTNGNGELHVTVDDEHLAVGEKRDDEWKHYRRYADGDRGYKSKPEECRKCRHPAHGGDGRFGFRHRYRPG